MRAARMWLLSLPLALCAVAADAGAQVPGISVQLVPKIGAYLPVSDLAEAQSGAQTIAKELEASLAIGLGVELDLPMLPVNLRGNLEYATGSEVSSEGVGAEANETTLLVVVGDVVFRPLPRIVVVQPYLLAGAGLKRYDFDIQEGTATAFDDESDFTFHLGVGVDIKLGPIALLAEVSDYISKFEPANGTTGESESKTQNDLFGMVGFKVGLF